ncbi:MAG: aminotransferase class IV [Pseudomonadota bacterium]
MELKEINKENFFLNLPPGKAHWKKDYLAMYSTQWQGYVVDPDLMMIPVDDHLVHRGDGVFDVIRCVNNKIYQLEAHLKRLDRSARSISLKFPPEYAHIREIIKALIKEGGEKNCIIRIILSRGPGSFNTNPYDCPLSQLYVNAVRFKESPPDHYEKGIALITSKIPIKKSFFATIKSCNYLPNVLMKKEAVDKGFEYSVSLDEDGFLAEGSTENIGLVSGEGYLKFPGFQRTLAGVTVNRIFELADALKKEGLIRDVQFAKISLDEAYLCSEIFLTGTSINVVPIVRFDGKRIGKGSPGPVYFRLSSLLREDMTKNQDLLTEVD